MSRYAAETSVTPARSRAEIEDTVSRYGADQFGYAVDHDHAAIVFRKDARNYRLSVPLPDPKDRAFTLTAHKNPQQRTAIQARESWEQACRQRWRALSLLVKAKMEAVELGVSTIEDEFLANTVMPSGETVGEWARPQVDQLYLTGAPLPRLLAAG